MSKEYRAKVFKSGNSLALRLPKELGLKEGSTMVLREESSGYRFEPEEAPRKKLDVNKFWRKAKHLRVPERRDFNERRDAIENFVSVVPIVPFDETAARAYANLPFRRASFDLLIAAQAQAIDATIVTNNEADFADVPRLKVENWAV